jgi:hypothetical protein
LSGGGIGLLLCAGAGATAAYSIDSRGPWHTEAQLSPAAAQVTDLAFARDGTAVLSGCDPKARAAGDPLSPDLDRCWAFVRSPAALGEARWYEASFPHAIGYHPVSGGRALAVLARDAHSVSVATCAGSGRSSTDEVGLVDQRKVNSAEPIFEIYEKDGWLVTGIPSRPLLLLP